MKRFLAAGLCLCVCAVLGACQTLQEKRRVDYRGTRALPSLEVPPELSTVPQPNPSLPEGAPGTASATYSEFAAGAKALPRDSVLPRVSGMRLERDGQARWLVAQASPQDLWPRVRGFVTDIGLVVESENPAAGVIETAWAENRAPVGDTFKQMLARTFGTLFSTATRDKYRFRLEHGLQTGTTEIYISHRGIEEIAVRGPKGDATGTQWVTRPPDPGLEAEILRLLLAHLGASQAQASALVAQAPAPVPERARLLRDADAVSLALADSIERAWRRVGLALDRLGFTLEDRDRSQGVYYVRYIDPDERDHRPGFFARMFGAEEKTSDRYQIRLQPASSGTQVEVRTDEGAADAGAAGERILGLLYEQLK